MPRLTRLKIAPVHLRADAMNRILKAVGKPLLARAKVRLRRDLDGSCSSFVDLNTAKRDSAYRKFIKTTPLNQFLGDSLAKLFDRHFGKDVRAKWAGSRSHPTDSSGPPGGPYVRFAIAVMHEMGHGISPHTVDAAIKLVRKRGRYQADPKEGTKKDGLVFKDGCWQEHG